MKSESVVSPLKGSEQEIILLSTASFYDTRKYVSEDDKPESFYHGLLLGMIARESS